MKAWAFPPMKGSRDEARSPAGFQPPLEAASPLRAQSAGVDRASLASSLWGVLSERVPSEEWLEQTCFSDALSHAGRADPERGADWRVPLTG